MYSSQIKRLAKNTIEIEVEITKDTIKKEFDLAFNKLQQNLEVQGFRKGKAPKEIAEKYIKKESVYEELIRTLIPKIYQEIVQKEGLKPVISPKIDLVNAKDGEDWFRLNRDWKIKISLAEKPTIELGNYKEAIKKIKSEKEKSAIWVPGKKAAPEQISEQEKAKKQQKLLNSILGALLKEVSCDISDLIIEEELNHRLANLVEDIRKIGLTVETYLKSKNLTQEELRKRYTQEIQETYKIEFILSELADKEGIKVEQKDLDELFAKITDQKEREAAKANAYFYASVLRKQKTLDYLISM